MVDEPSGPTWGAPPPPAPPPPAPPPPPPPYPAAGGGWPAPVPQPFRSLRGLAVAMTVLLAIDAVVAAILVPLGLHERQVAHDATSFGVLVVTDKVRDAVDAVNGVAGIHFLLFLAIAVLWMIWMWRAATNTALLRRFKPRFASGFAIGGWFIPIAFWIIPGMHMYDIDKGSGPPVGAGERPRGSGLLVGWWILFVIGWAGSGFGQVTLKLGHRYDASSFDVRNFVFVVAMLAMLAAAVLAILVVRSITRAQHSAWVAVAGGGTPPDPFAPSAPSAPWTPAAPPAGAAHRAVPRHRRRRPRAVPRHPRRRGPDRRRQTRSSRSTACIASSSFSPPDPWSAASSTQ